MNLKLNRRALLVSGTATAAAMSATLSKAQSNAGSPAGSKPAPRQAADSELPATRLDVRDFGARGDGVADDTASIQAAIDAALSSGIQTILIPEGHFRTTDTLHLGYGDTFRQISLIGLTRAAYAGKLSGATLQPERTDRPCINVQGGRNITIRGLAIDGKLRPFISKLLFEDGHFSADPADWLDATLAPTGLDRFRPYAAITIDAYAGERPPESYPDVSYPSAFAGKGQYRRTFSSGVHVENCDIQGFAIGFANQPCDADGNADFTKIRDCQFGYCVYAVAICNGQSRNVEIRNTEYAGCHTFLTNGHFGKARGQLGGPIDNVSGSSSYQFIDILAPGFASAVRVSNLYFERHVAIGNFGGGAAWPGGLVFDSCHFSFGDLPAHEGGTGVTARAAIESGGNAGVTFRQCVFRMFETMLVPVHFTGHVINAHTPPVLFEGCSVIPGWAVSAGTDRAIAQAINWFGGLFVPSLFGQRLEILGGLMGTYFPAGQEHQRPTAQLITHVPAPAINGARTVLHPSTRSIMDSAGAIWRLRNGPFAVGISAASTYWPKALHLEGRTLIGGYATSLMENDKISIAYLIEAGDLFWIPSNGQLFVIESIVKNAEQEYYDLTAKLLNGFTTGKDSDQRAQHDLGVPSLIYIIKTGLQLPEAVYFGDFRKGETLVANVHQGDGDGAMISQRLVTGDLLPEAPQGDAKHDCPTPPRTRIVSVRDGRPGEITISRAAERTGRYAILPVLIS